ncbi:hypothetical protein [Micromonospora endolithica]|uniref:Uncharacterized protein n=1 Tax=Micromonospora endolithica TaxID=230091 RepID=A0A3A9YT55_9ACTN|nr:hypothetical protein [Micromonospora endolithica]RKN38477.1 hypothetical protein D7223_31230 [Micromonospora endolithica]TWJ23099.1 hypothetical protein JD76_03228 [Micromonospora endolithica]
MSATDPSPVMAWRTRRTWRAALTNLLTAAGSWAHASARPAQEPEPEHTGADETWGTELRSATDQLLADEPTGRHAHGHVKTVDPDHGLSIPAFQTITREDEKFFPVGPDEDTGLLNARRVWPVNDTAAWPTVDRQQALAQLRDAGEDL